MPGFEVVGEAEAGNVGVRMATDLEVDLVVMDISMPGMDGIEATRQIIERAPDTKVLIFSTNTNEQAVPSAFAAGAAGYLLKDASAKEMLDALRTIMAGERYVSSGLPTELKSEPTSVATKLSTAPVPTQPARRNYRVVLVDDSQIVRERVASALSAAGSIEVVGQGNDVVEGLRLIEQTKPDLLILDISLPGESGVSLLEKVKKNHLVPRVMMLTNQDHPRLRQHCQELGADHYFYKPTEFEKLIDLCLKLAEAHNQAGAGTVGTRAAQPTKIHVQPFETEVESEVLLHRANNDLQKEIIERERLQRVVQGQQECYGQLLGLTHEGMARFEARQPLATVLPEVEQAEFILDHFRLIECNEAFARQSGLTQTIDLVGSPFANSLPGRREDQLALVRRFIQSGYRLTVDPDVPGRLRSGERNTCVGMVQGKQLARIWVTRADAAPSQTIAEQLRDQAHMLDRAQDAIIVRDLHDRILYWNESARNLYGWPAEEVLGRTFGEFMPTDGSRSPEVQQALLKEGEWRGEVRTQTRNGEEIVIESRLTLIRHSNGQPKSILAINTDVTERKKLETQFMRAQRMESIGMLAGGIAHDLNNVLAPIMMSSQLLELTLTHPDHRKLTGIISASARRGADLVKQVLTFYRADKNTRQEVSPLQLLQDLQYIIGETFPKSIHLELKTAKGIWPVAADPTQLHQVLLNLCLNARDAMPEGGQLTVSVENIMFSNSAAEPRPHVLVTVADTGAGITPEIREKIFAPFFTTKAPGKGTGLGLSTSLAIIKNHGGVIQVDSEPGKGAVFKVHLPAMQGVLTAEPVEPVQNPRGNGELILVVDDEASARLIMTQALQTYGYRTISAKDGADALAIYQQQAGDIAVVLVDLVMPGMDGAATIRKLIEINPAARVIAASAVETDGTRVVTDGTVRAFLAKPYTAGALLKTLHGVLSGGGEPEGNATTPSRS